MNQNRNIVLTAANQITTGNAIPLHSCLGILQLAACLREQGMQCEVIDLEEFHKLGGSDWDMVMERTAGKIMAAAPRVTGISTLSMHLIYALEICNRIKKLDSSVFTLLGGPGVSFCAVEILETYPAVDAIIRGEADRVFPEVMKAVLCGTEVIREKGLVYRQADRIIDQGWPDPVEDLGTLPMPLLLPVNKDENYESDISWGYFVEIGRGCPFNCAFCSTSRFFGRKYRLKPVKRIIREIREIREHYGNKTIFLSHDLLVLDYGYMRELCAELRTGLPGVRWGCHLRLDNITPRLLRQMRNAGCAYVFFGIETATARMQRMINKHLDLSCTGKILKCLASLNLKAIISFIAGFPGESLMEREALFALTLQAKFCSPRCFKIFILLLRPEQGAPLFQEWKDKLTFNPYLTPEESNLPENWEHLKSIIRNNPLLFAFHFSFNADTRDKTQALKCSFFGSLLNRVMLYSLWFTYLQLGAKLASALAASIDKLALPVIDHNSRINHLPLMRSVCRVIQPLLKKRKKAHRVFNSLVQYELAAEEVSFYRKSTCSKIIKTYINPMTVMAALESRKIFALEHLRLKAEPLYFILQWDEAQCALQFRQIPYELTGLL